MGGPQRALGGVVFSDGFANEGIIEDNIQVSGKELVAVLFQSNTKKHVWG